MLFDEWFRLRCVKDRWSAVAVSTLYADYLRHCGKGQAIGKHYFRRMLQHAARGSWRTYKSRLLRIGMRLRDGEEFAGSHVVEADARAGCAAQREHWRKMREADST